LKQHKNQQIYRQASKHKTTATPYTIELLESRVLLSADFAGVVQVLPVNQLPVPQQAVVLHVQPPTATIQQTSVSEMLSKPAGSFPPTSNEADEATTHASQVTNAASGTLAQSAETHRRMSNQLSNADSQLQQTARNQSHAATQSQSLATSAISTVENEATLPPAMQQSQQIRTVQQMLALPAQASITQTPMQQSVVSPMPTLPQPPSSSTQVSDEPLQSQPGLPGYDTGSTATSEPLPSGQPLSNATTGSSSQWATILQTWEANMVKYGRQHGELMLSYDAMTGAEADAFSDTKLGSTYYDAEHVFYQIAEYTGDQSWLQYADLAEKFYRDEFVTPLKGQVPGYWNFTSGLLTDYLRTGDQQSKSALLSIAQNGSYARDNTPLEWTASAVYARDVSYAVISYTNAEILGEPVRERKGELINQLLDYIDQWFVRYNVPPGGEPHPVDYLKPFFVGLDMHALIYSYEHSPDPRIPEAISIALEGLWNRAWMPDQQAFWYSNGDAGNVPAYTPAPDLNLLIAPAYAWMYQHTGDVTYRDRGDQIFAGGVAQAYLDGAKQFNQNYQWSFDYVAWRGN
jgi:hypothetical protein